MGAIGIGGRIVGLRFAMSKGVLEEPNVELPATTVENVGSNNRVSSDLAPL
jgi:hypothetical protein